MRKRQATSPAMVRVGGKTGRPATGGGAWAVRGGGLVIVLAVLAAYSNSLHGPFILDDVGCIAANPSIRSFQPIWGPLKPPKDIGIAGRPVVNLSLAINYAVSGLNVWSYHAFNAAIHALAALVLFGLIRRTLRLPVMQGRFDRVATALATAVALLWTLHPLQTQAVTYIIQRCESLMGLLFLLTLYCLLRGAAGPSRASGSNERRAVVWYMASASACAAGMGCKAVMAVAPILALAYDALFLTGSLRRSLQRRWGLYLALAATWGLLAVLLAGGRSDITGFDIKVSPLHYALTQLWVIPHYLLLTFWPRELVLDYGLAPITDWQRLLAPGLAVAGMVVATAWTLWRHRLWGFLGLWFFLILAPSSSIVPVPDAVFEHRMYLSLAAVAALLVVGGYLLARRVLAWRGAPAALGWAVGAALVAAGVGALGTRTYLRNADYRTAVGIWEDTAAERPENPRAHHCLGEAYEKAGRWGLATVQFDRAIELSPLDTSIFLARGDLFGRQGRGDRAIADYTRAIEIDPSLAVAYNNRGMCRMDAGAYDSALRDFDQALALEPRKAEGHFNRAVCRYRLKDYAGARQDVKRCVELGGSPAAGFLKVLNEAPP